MFFVLRKSSRDGNSLCFQPSSELLTVSQLDPWMGGKYISEIDGLGSTFSQEKIRKEVKIKSGSLIFIVENLMI